jgi:hypothetical protein
MRDYLKAGYEVVQVAWAFPWEESSNPPPYGTQPLGNIQASACRSATFLSYAFNSPSMYQGVSKNNPSAGMCAQGASAGSAEVAYSLSYYGAPAGTQWWLDNVELISGPVFGDIKQGCIQPPPMNPTTVCPPGQWGCQLGTGGSSWSLYPTYLKGANYGVGTWTDDLSCANGSTTSEASNALWLAQSIVDQGTGVLPTFSYPHTAMSAWLCRSVAFQQSAQNCSKNYIKYENSCPNNSSPQGQFFYAQIAAGSPSSYNVYAVDSCAGPEGAGSSGSTVLALNSQDGYDAIKYDMIGGGSNNRPVGCIHGH